MRGDGGEEQSHCQRSSLTRGACRNPGARSERQRDLHNKPAFSGRDRNNVCAGLRDEDRRRLLGLRGTVVAEDGGDMGKSCVRGPRRFAGNIYDRVEEGMTSRASGNLTLMLNAISSQVVRNK